MLAELKWMDKRPFLPSLIAKSTVSWIHDMASLIKLSPFPAPGLPGPSACCVSWWSPLWGLPPFPWVEFFLSSLGTLLYFSAPLRHAQSLGFVHQILNLRWYDALDYSTPTKWPNLHSFYPELSKCMISGKALNSLNICFFLYPAGVMWYLCERLSWGWTKTKKAAV